VVLVDRVNWHACVHNEVISFLRMIVTIRCLASIRSFTFVVVLHHDGFGRGLLGNLREWKFGNEVVDMKDCKKLPKCFGEKIIMERSEEVFE